MKLKTIIITGGAGFLGSKFCRYFAENNYEVICIDNNESKLRSINRKNILTYKADITKEEDIKSIFKNFKKKNIYGLINNAAIDAVPSKISKNNLKYPSLSSWHKELDVSVIGAFLMIKYFGEKMTTNRKGSIINIGSDLSLIAPNQKIYKKAYPNYFKPPTYSVIKHALLGMTKYYASLYAVSNVRVNMVSPGPIKNKQNSKLISEIKNIIPMNRLGKYQDLFALIRFLIDDQSNFITGQNIFVDGGRTII